MRQPIGDAYVCTVTKGIEITLPSWVNDYDVLVEYINCGPATAAQRVDPYHVGSTSASIGLGGGLFINKGPIVNTTTGQKKAVIRINSIASPYATNNEDGMGMSGKNMDAEGRNSNGTAGLGANFCAAMGTGWQMRSQYPQFGGACDDIVWRWAPTATGRVGSLTNGMEFGWLAYSVCLPQFRNQNYGMFYQNQGSAENGTGGVTRFAPKFGAAYYPTVKYTVIGYTSRMMDQNAAYNAQNNWTMLQQTSFGQAHSLLQPDTAPMQVQLSKVNIENIV